MIITPLGVLIKGLKNKVVERAHMKVGIRKPSIKKSIKARTTGKAKRALKKAVIPGYGKKGTGWIKDPKRAAYNKVYNKTTIGVDDLIKSTASSSSKSTNHRASTNLNADFKPNSSSLTYSICGIIMYVIGTIVALFGFLFITESFLGGLIIALLGIFFVLIGRKFKSISRLLKESKKSIS